ncbi:YihY/virulence factor BrkB family protein [Knoellia aerolata]|uniref:Ribonuclease BN n=1 Tax=Knoellia aerolata DSM 18566 TaxID=1385519 RepID=A0A0A0JWJ1_9MICO|nr:YihY/virulence factor BrkB family protein [Knoellia aerolata]KGN41019.1 ribonuclease BN [Knoellia aerolata DSM 18566]
MTDAKRRLRGWLARFPALLALARLTVETIRICLRYRVTGLASEAGFFALLSLPPLVLGLFGGVGYVGRWLGQDTVEQVRVAVSEYAARFLTEDVISTTLSPTVDDVFTDGRFDLISVGFLLSLWSGSRALNVLVDTVSIMYGQSGLRGIVPTRALSFSLYVVALLVGVVMIPLVLIGPTLLGQFLPEGWDFLTALYWPVVSLLVIAAFTSLYHVSTPRRSPWTRDLPGACVTLGIWVVASFAVRGTIAASLGGTSIYGPLSAPIVLLIWLYMLAIAVLIGAALNAGIRNLWPSSEQRGLRERFAFWLRPATSGPTAGATDDGADGDDGEDTGPATDDDLDLDGIRDAARRPLTPISDDETLVIPRIRVGSGR